MKNLSKTNISTLEIENEVIWFPEWKHFKIIKVNNIYRLFESGQLVFQSLSLETVKTELFERFHFYEIGNH